MAFIHALMLSRAYLSVSYAFLLPLDSICLARCIGLLSPLRPSVCHTGGSVKTVEFTV